MTVIKRYFLYILLSGMCGASYAQKRTTPTIHPVPYCMENYLFEQAETQLQKTIDTKKRRKQPFDEEEAELATARKGKRMIYGTQQVVFIDSMVVNRNNFLQSYKLGKEAGRIDSYDNFFGTKENYDGMVYVTERGTKCYYSRPTLDGGLELYTSDLIGGKWTEPSRLNGLDEPVQNYPFMMADGITLYYAAEGEESLGGYDIFVTRYNSDTQQYLKPENIGMPFNSPANDYLYAVDEINNIGWFVTDRNQPEDSVCIYMFIPSDTREVYNYESGDKEAIARAARIYAIADTWGDATQVNQARQRLQNLLNTQQTVTPADAFQLIINDQITYTKPSDIKTEEGKKLFSTWKESVAALQKTDSDLEKLRNQYTEADKATKQRYKAQILSLEKKHEELQQSVAKAEKRLRNAENKK